MKANPLLEDLWRVKDYLRADESRQPRPLLWTADVATDKRMRDAAKLLGCALLPV